MHLQFGADDDDRTARIVDTLTEQVLTEATLLALEGVGERLEGAVAIGFDAGDLAAIVEQGVDRFLKHALLVAHDDFRSFNLDETFQTVVADDNTTIELVDVGSGKTTTIQRHKGTQVGRDNRNDIHNHPLGTVVHTAGTHRTLRLTERLDDIQTFESLLLAGHGSLLGGLGTQVIAELVEVEVAEERVESFGTHTGDELVGVLVVRVGVGQLLITLGQRILNIVVFLLSEQVEFLHRKFVEHTLTRLQNNILLVVDDLIEFLGRDVEEGANLVRQRAEEPDVGDRNHQFDVTHTLTADLLLGDFDAAAVADDTLIADTFVLATVALPVAGGAEDALAEQAIAFGLVGAIVYGFRLRHLTVGTALDRLGRCQADGDRIEIGLYLRFLFKSHCTFLST